jgi:hypothetical protein
LLCVVAAASAQTYVYQFSGHVTGFSQPFTTLVPDAQIGQSFSGWFSYHSDPPLDGSNAMGDALQDASLVFTLGDFTFSHLDDYTMLFLQNPSSEGYDYFRVTTYGTQGDIEYWRTGVNFTDSTQTAFDTASVVPESLTPSMFDTNGVKLDFFSDDHGYMNGVIDSLVMVPEPTGIALLLCGGLLLRCKQA